MPHEWGRIFRLWCPHKTPKLGGGGGVEGADNSKMMLHNTGCAYFLFRWFPWVYSRFATIETAVNRPSSTETHPLHCLAYCKTIAKLRLQCTKNKHKIAPNYWYIIVQDHFKLYKVTVRVQWTSVTELSFHLWASAMSLGFENPETNSRFRLDHTRSSGIGLQVFGYL